MNINDIEELIKTEKELNHYKLLPNKYSKNDKYNSIYYDIVLGKIKTLNPVDLEGFSTIQVKTLVSNFYYKNAPYDYRVFKNDKPLTTDEDLYDFEILKKSYNSTKYYLELKLNNLNNKTPIIKADIYKRNIDLKNITELYNKCLAIQSYLQPSEKSIAYFYYLYNNGKFRTDEEIKALNKYLSNEEWFKSDDYFKLIEKQLTLTTVISLIFAGLPFMNFEIGCLLYECFIWPIIWFLFTIFTWLFVDKNCFFTEEYPKYHNDYNRNFKRSFYTSLIAVSGFSFIKRLLK